MLLERIGRALDAALAAAVSSWRGEQPISPQELADYTIRAVPEWRQDITPQDERERIKAEGKRTAKASEELRAEVRVIARQQGVDLR